MSSEWVMIIMQVLHCLDLFSPVLRSVPAIILRDQPSCCQLRCPVTAPCHHSLFPFLSHTPYAQPTQVPWWHEVKSLWPWNFIAESHRSQRWSLFYTTQHRWDFSGHLLGTVGHPEHAIAPDRELLLHFHCSTCAERRESRRRPFPKHNPLPNGCTFQYLPLDSSAFTSVFSCNFALRQRNSDGLANRDFSA